MKLNLYGSKLRRKIGSAFCGPVKWKLTVDRKPDINDRAYVHMNTSCNAGNWYMW